jgi:hypothetical protein
MPNDADDDSVLQRGIVRVIRTRFTRNALRKARPVARLSADSLQETQAESIDLKSVAVASRMTQGQ